jgi:GTP-binding protein
MNFIDKVLVDVKAGNGGNGSISFRQEKFIDRGGPDGGDGGKGANVVFRASRNQNTLAAFRYQRAVYAPHGQAGSMRRKHGRSGKDMFVDVPVGTTIVIAEGSQEGTMLADLSEDGQIAIIAKGGRGGFGNAHFISSVRQAPKFAEKGEQGEAFILRLEIKMIADIGLVGMPNAGKSTFLAATSNARPEIADYPFTTIKPNLGVVDIDDETSVLIADIPGLIAGAAEGKGLGHEFLRHVERTKVLIHLIDAYQEDVALAYQTIQEELRSYKIDLTDRPQVVGLNKTDGLSQDIIDDLLQQLRAVVPEGTEIFAISAQARLNVKQLLYGVKRELIAYKAAHVEEEETESVPILRLQDESLAWRVSKTSDGFLVSGNKIEKFAARTDFSNEQGVQRLREIMRKMGIMHELVRKKIESGQKIAIGGFGSFEY